MSKEDIEKEELKLVNNLRMSLPMAKLDLISSQLTKVISLREQEAMEEFWNYLKKIQMKNIDEDKPFLDGYLCLSGKQCNDIEKSFEKQEKNGYEM